MFSFLSGVVLRRPWAVVLAWLALTFGLYYFGPRWDEVTKDDDVRFFPPGSTSVIGQDLLERGFPRDASSSQLVLVYERKDHAVTPADRRHLEEVASNLFQFALANPELRHRETPRLACHAADRPAADRQERRGDRTRGALDRKVSGDIPFQEDASRCRSDPQVAQGRGPARLRQGSNRLVTGSAAVGRDTNVAATQSIKTRLTATIGLVVLILLIVYRSPLLAMIPLVTIVLSVMVSLRLIALIDVLSGSGLQGHQHHPGFRHRRALRRRHRLLPVLDRTLLRRAHHRSRRQAMRLRRERSLRSVPPWSPAPAR